MPEPSYSERERVLSDVLRNIILPLSNFTPDRYVRGSREMLISDDNLEAARAALEPTDPAPSTTEGVGGDDGNQIWVDAEQLARRFHETYERLASRHGYETRPESAVPWEQVPANNRDLMVDVCHELIAQRATEGAREGERFTRDQIEAVVTRMREAHWPDEWITRLRSSLAARAPEQLLDEVREGPRLDRLSWEGGYIAACTDRASGVFPGNDAAVKVFAQRSWKATGADAAAASPNPRPGQ